MREIFAGWLAASFVVLTAVCVTAGETPPARTGDTVNTAGGAEGHQPEDHGGGGCPPLLGLDPPGPTPEPFAPELFGRVEARLHGAVVVSPDGDHICWAALPPAVMCVHCKGGLWTGPRTLPLPGRGVQAPAFSPDGRLLYYQAAGPGGLGSLDIWRVDLGSGDWTSAENLGSPVNGPGAEGQPSLTVDGELFFTGSLEGVGFGRGIFHAVPTDGGYQPPRALGAAVNTPGIDFYPFVARDGRTLLFASNRGREGEELSLHVTRRTPEGGWIEPVDIHPSMDFHDTARFPSISPDGRVLFFLSGGRFWWVDASVLDVEAPSVGTPGPAA